MPAFIAPQLARLVEAPPSGPNWVHEVKFDGYRMQMRAERHSARLRTRKALDWTARFPEIADDGRALAGCIIDGEICAIDARGVSDFGLLQTALSDHSTAALVYYAFDCLFADGRAMERESLDTRKKMLKQVLKPLARSRRIRFVPHFHARGGTMLASACKAGLEGIISKRFDAPYVPGRSDSWTKSKCRGGQEVVIGAWRGAKGRFRSLLVGAYRDGKLIYMGRVGTGYGGKVAADLLRRLEPLRRGTSPFANAPPRLPDVNWVEPALVAEIEFENVTSDGLFRQAAFKGLRLDKPARAVIPETPALAPKERTMPARKTAARDDSTVLGITISHPDKELWPKSKLGPAVTKRDLARYMADAASRVLPHVKDRPLSVVRTPDGIEGERFFQRHELKGTAAPMLAIRVKGEPKPYLGVDSAEGLVALAQQGVTELHPWGCRPGDPETPERIIFDLDPAPDVPFARVIEAAKDLRKRLRALAFTSFVKTTGGKGLHVVIAIRGASWEQAKAFAKAVALAVEAEAPDRYTTTVAKKARGGKIFVDYLRNDMTSTAVAPWSPRAREGATIAVPLNWNELTTRLDPAKFTIPVAAKLLRKADPWKDLAKSARALAPAMRRLAK
jgi:bifunctional non-homologous end joining protein LigD